MPAAAKQWTAEETEQLRQLFQDDLETGAIEELKVKEVLSTTPLKKERSLEAVVLKLRKMREEDMKAKQPPCEEETSRENYIEVSRFSSIHTSIHSTHLGIGFC